MRGKRGVSFTIAAAVFLALIAVASGQEAGGASAWGPVHRVGPTTLAAVRGVDDSGRYLAVDALPSSHGIFDLTTGALVGSTPDGLLIGDGSALLVSTTASLTAGDSDGGAGDVYRYELGTGLYTLLTGGLSNLRSYRAGAASSDGRFVLLDDVGMTQISAVWRLDTANGQSVELDTPLAGTSANDGLSIAEGMSSDGRISLFRHLVPIGSTQVIAGSVWVHDAQTGQLTVVDPATQTLDAQISGDGRSVAFLVGYPAIGLPSTLYERDLQAGTTVLVAHGVFRGSPPPMSLSRDGVRLAYVMPDAAGNPQAYVWSRTPGTTEQVSVTPSGTAPDAATSSVVISPTGDRVAFGSAASNLVSGQAFAGGVFAREPVAVDPPPPTTVLVTTTATTTSTTSIPTTSTTGTTPTTTTTTTTTPSGTPTGSAPAFAPLSPVRLLDTRVGGSTFDHRFEGGGRLLAGVPLRLRVSGRVGPALPTAVALNVTVVDPDGPGYATVWPCDTATPPNASNLNFDRGEVVANLVVVPVDIFNDVCIEVIGASAHLLADIAGYSPTGAAYAPSPPRRLLDTRDGATTFDGRFQGIGRQLVGQRLEVQVTERAGVPAGARAAVLNVTLVGPDAAGYLTVWPCDSATPPNASNLNVTAGETVPNLVVVQLSPRGTVCIQTTQTGGDLIADLAGSFPATSTFVPVAPARLLDSRRGGHTVDQRFADVPAVHDQQVVELTVAGRAGVPEHASMAVLNLTATDGAAGGFVTIWPCESTAGAVPEVSSLNLRSSDVANVVLAPLSSHGTICLQTRVHGANLLADLAGYVPG